MIKCTICNGAGSCEVDNDGPNRPIFGLCTACNGIGQVVPTTEQKVLADEPTIGHGDASKCLPGWIKSFCKAHESGEGITLSPAATTALCHTLIAARARAERLVKERDELQRYIDVQERNGL